MRIWNTKISGWCFSNICILYMVHMHMHCMFVQVCEFVPFMQLDRLACVRCLFSKIVSSYDHHVTRLLPVTNCFLTTFVELLSAAVDCQDEFGSWAPPENAHKRCFPAILLCLSRPGVYFTPTVLHASIVTPTACTPHYT